MEDYKKILQPSKKQLILCIVLIVISVAAFIGAQILSTPRKGEKCTYFGTLIELDQDEENKYAKIDIVTPPYEFATKTQDSSTERFYFVADEDNFIYIVRLSTKKYDEIKKLTDEQGENFRYELKGYLFNTPAQLKKLAISGYNAGRPADQKISSADFQAYFGKTYLDDKITPTTEYATVCILVGFFFSIFSTVSIIVLIINVVNTKKTLKKYSKEDLEAELEKESTISYKKSKLYLTDKYVVYGYQGLHVEEYDNISWVYIEKRKQNGVTVGKFLIIVTNAGKKKYVTNCSNEDTLVEMITHISGKNNNILVGFTSENIKENKKRIKERKTNKRN